MKPKQLWIVAVVASLVAMNACEMVRLDEYVHVEDFETLCDGAPCGWERTAGDETQATWVETIHPGEHGLQLSGETSVRGPGSEPDEPFDASDLTLFLTARCDEGSELSVEVVLAGENGEQMVRSTTARLRAEWTAFAHPWLDHSTDALATHILAFGITKTGAGACEISELALRIPGYPVGC